MNNSIEVKLQAGIRGFAEDKDEAKRLRVETILPALLKDQRVILNFKYVKYSTQSFVHALVGEPLQKFGEAVLERLEFRSCAPQVKSLVQLVVDYSLGGFSTDSSKMDDIRDATPRRPVKPSKPKARTAQKVKRRAKIAPASHASDEKG